MGSQENEECLPSPSPNVPADVEPIKIEPQIVKEKLPTKVPMMNDNYDEKAPTRRKDVIREGMQEGYKLAAPATTVLFYTLQKRYFDCSYECFDETKTQVEINECMRKCRVPVANVENRIDAAMAGLRFNLNITMDRCGALYEEDRLQNKADAFKKMEHCCEGARKASLKVFSSLINKLEADLGIDNPNK